MRSLERLWSRSSDNRDLPIPRRKVYYNTTAISLYYIIITHFYSRQGFGLPSSHAQSLFYFCTVLSTIFFSRCSSVLLATFFSASMFIYAYFAWWIIWSPLQHLPFLVAYVNFCTLLSNCCINYLPTHLLTYLHTYLFTYLLLTNLLTYLLSYLLTYVLAYLLTFLLSLWRVKTKLHTAFQTFAGLAFGSSFAMAMFLSESRAYPIVGRYLEGGNSAAFAVRLFISIIGIAVIFSKELKPFLKKLK